MPSPLTAGDELVAYARVRSKHDVQPGDPPEPERDPRVDQAALHLISIVAVDLEVLKLKVLDGAVLLVHVLSFPLGLSAPASQHEADAV
jgi:hypothetical protein